MPPARVRTATRRDGTRGGNRWDASGGAARLHRTGEAYGSFWSLPPAPTVARASYSNGNLLSPLFARSGPVFVRIFTLVSFFLFLGGYSKDIAVSSGRGNEGLRANRAGRTRAHFWRRRDGRDSRPAVVWRTASKRRTQAREPRGFA